MNETRGRRFFWEFAAYLLMPVFVSAILATTVRLLGGSSVDAVSVLMVAWVVLIIGSAFTAMLRSL